MNLESVISEFDHTQEPELNSVVPVNVPFFREKSGTTESIIVS